MHLRSACLRPGQCRFCHQQQEAIDASRQQSDEKFYPPPLHAYPRGTQAASSRPSWEPFGGRAGPRPCRVKEIVLPAMVAWLQERQWLAADDTLP